MGIDVRITAKRLTVLGCRSLFIGFMIAATPLYALDPPLDVLNPPADLGGGTDVEVDNSAQSLYQGPAPRPGPT